MKLCVGAVSRRVVEEAAKLQVHQIIASRRQVDIGGGYTGLDQRELVELVKEYSSGKTLVVRDHGGPKQGNSPMDDGFDSLEADVAAVFDGLHLDVCKLPAEIQCERLRQLVERFDGRAALEIGGEHESHSWNERLLEASKITPSYFVIGFGSFVWADRQCGRPLTPEECLTISERYSFSTKVHNMDWIGKRRDYEYSVGAYNIAPEFAKVEIDALLTVLSFNEARSILHKAYQSGAWRRWFESYEGTWDERARCALRYVMNELDLQLSDEQDGFVRSRIQDAIIRG